MASTQQVQMCETAPGQTRPAVRTEPALPQQSAVRDVPLDIVKGACVIVMALYHTVGYFPDSPLSLKYSAFVTGAFIFLAGFVATNVYLEKYNSRSEWIRICQRLGVRGIKLILIAIVLNLALVQLPHIDGKQRTDAISTLHSLLLGVNYHSISFDLLVLIGYTLLGIAVLLAVGRGSHFLLIPFAVLAVIYATISNYFRWPADYYVRLLAIGQVGAALGLVKRPTIMNLGLRLEWVMALYFLQLLAMVLWPPGYLLYTANVLCTVAAIYVVASKCNPRSWLCRKLVLLGKYSLLSYLFQIAFLQIARHVWDFMDEEVVAVFLLTCAATLGCVELVERLRRVSKWIEGPYRFVFS